MTVGSCCGFEWVCDQQAESFCTLFNTNDRKMSTELNFAVHKSSTSEDKGTNSILPNFELTGLLTLHFFTSSMSLCFYRRQHYTTHWHWTCMCLTIFADIVIIFAHMLMVTVYRLTVCPDR